MEHVIFNRSLELCVEAVIFDYPLELYISFKKAYVFFCVEIFYLVFIIDKVNHL